MTPIYHITHVRNLPSIVRCGGLYCDNERVKVGLQSVGIAHNHIKERRARRVVTTCMQGNLGEYVPFYFAPRSPMLYAIAHGFVKDYLDGEDAVVHLVATAEAAASRGLPFTFTDGHAELAVSKFFDSLSQLAGEVDWKIMGSQYWKDTAEEPDRKRKRQAEFLIHHFVPWSLVENIGVKTAAMQKSVVEMLASSVHRPAVRVEQKWYYR